jgi:predicted GNAT family N-acyltransferase
MLKKVHEIRKTVFVEEQACPEDIEWEFEEESNHYAAELNGTIVGTARWRFTDKGIKLERFAVLKPYRNHEVGKALLLRILADTQAHNKLRYLHAQLPARNFYQRHGFTAQGEHFWEADIEHVKMVILPAPQLS